MCLYLHSSMSFKHVYITHGRSSRSKKMTRKKKKKRSPVPSGALPMHCVLEGGTGYSQYNITMEELVDGSAARRKLIESVGTSADWFPIISFWYYIYKRLKRDLQQINGEERTKESISRAFIPRQQQEQNSPFPLITASQEHTHTLAFTNKRQFRQRRICNPLSFLLSCRDAPTCIGPVYR